MRFIRITNKQKYHNMPSGAILHKHRTKREDSSRWHIMIHPSIVAILLIGTIYTIIVYTCHNVNASNSVSFTIDNSDTVLELTLPSSVTLDLVPSSTNNYVSFGTSDLSILAGTNNPYGLTLTMSVPNTNLTNSSLTITNDNTNNPNNIPLDSSNHPIIPTLSSGTTYTENTFTTNSWGYKLSTNTNYSSVPSSLELLNTDSASNAITTTLNLAAKVDSTRPAGVYSTVLNFATIANAPTLNCNVDLTGCTFYFNDVIYTKDSGWWAKINFTSAGSDYAYIYTIRWYESGMLRGTDGGAPMPPGGFGENRMEYYYGDGSIYACQGEPGTDYVSDWADQSYRTITITGGEDVTNSEIINWLYDNATLVSN